MAKQKGQFTHESVRISADHAGKVRQQVIKTRQSICGFIELAIDEKLQREGIPTLDRQIMKQIEEFAPDVTKEPKLQGILNNPQEWPIKKETK